LQHVCRDASCRAGSSATADTCAIHNDDDDDDLCVSCSLLCSLWVMLVCEWSSLPAAVADASGASNQRCHNTDTDVSSSVSTTN